MNRVVLTKDEGRWFARNVIKSHYVMLEAARQDPEITKRTTYKTLTQLLPQAGEIDRVLGQLKGEPFELEVHLTPKQRTVIRSMIDGVVKLLNEKIIPEYRRRDPIPEQQLKEAELKVETLKKMARKMR